MSRAPEPVGEVSIQGKTRHGPLPTCPSVSIDLHGARGRAQPKTNKQWHCPNQGMPIGSHVGSRFPQVIENLESAELVIIPDQRHQTHQEEVGQHLGGLKHIRMHWPHIFALFERLVSFDKTHEVLAGNVQLALHLFHNSAQVHPGKLDEQEVHRRAPGGGIEAGSRVERGRPLPDAHQAQYQFHLLIKSQRGGGGRVGLKVAHQAQQS